MLLFVFPLDLTNGIAARRNRRGEADKDEKTEKASKEREEKASTEKEEKASKEKEEKASKEKEEKASKEREEKASKQAKKDADSRSANMILNQLRGGDVKAKPTENGDISRPDDEVSSRHRWRRDRGGMTHLYLFLSFLHLLF